jgi:hypothetical protein
MRCLSLERVCNRDADRRWPRMSQQVVWNCVCEGVSRPAMTANDPGRYASLSHMQRVVLCCWSNDLKIEDPRIKGEVLLGRPSPYALAWAGAHGVYPEELAEAYRGLADLWGADAAGVPGATNAVQ